MNLEIPPGGTVLINPHLPRWSQPPEPDPVAKWAQMRPAVVMSDSLPAKDVPYLIQWQEVNRHGRPMGPPHVIGSSE